MSKIKILGQLKEAAGAGDTMDVQLATTAGIAAGVAYLAEMAVDQSLLDCPTNDLLLLGGIVSRDQRVWPLVGLVGHMVLSNGMAHAYALVQQRLVGPPWVRGLTFIMVENAVLGLTLPLFDRWHPAIRSGQLPKMTRPIPIIQQTLRHMAYGIVLGLVYGNGRKR